MAALASVIDQGCMRQIEYLDLSAACGLTDDGIITLAKAMPEAYLKCDILAYTNHTRHN